MLTISDRELKMLRGLYARLKSDTAHKIGVKAEEGHIEIYDFYVESAEDVGVALYFDSRIHTQEEPLREYVTTTDAPVDTKRLGFFKGTGEPLNYKVEVLPDGYYALRVTLDEPIYKGERLNIYSKAHMGGKIWLETPHHQRWLKRDEPIFFDGARGVWKPRFFHATLWKMPKGCILYETFPQPWEVYAENDRLNILFVFHTVGYCKIYMKYLIPTNYQTRKMK